MEPEMMSQTAMKAHEDPKGEGAGAGTFHASSRHEDDPEIWFRRSAVVILTTVVVVLTLIGSWIVPRRPASLEALGFVALFTWLVGSLVYNRRSGDGQFAVFAILVVSAAWGLLALLG